MKANYAAWHIDANQFSRSWSNTDKLAFFARYAILAPSGHNTQPWQLQTRKDSIEVMLNQAHYLSIDGSGLLSIEPYVSIGTFLEVFSLAAQGFGYDIAIELFPNKKLIARVSIEKEIASQPELLTAIVTRVSNRNPYKSTLIDHATLSAVSANKFPGVKVSLVSERPDINFIASQTETAIVTIMSNPLYRKELSKWVRINQTRKYDGMPGFTHGFGGVKAYISQAAVRYLPQHGPQAKKSGELIRKSGGLIIARCANNQKESFVNVGRLYARVCVLANKHGFATSALGAAVLDPDTRAIISQHFNIQDRPVYILRLGKATVQSRHSPRWPLEKILSS